MKKVLLGMALVLAIAISVISGTMALYTTTIDEVADGSVVAKEFVLLENGSDTFKQDVAIAPGEAVNWTFSVKNYDGSVITETAMDLSFKLTISAADEMEAIQPLVITVKDEKGKTVGTQTGTGTISFADDFDLQATGQTHTYTVSIQWPSSDSDSNYTSANGDFGTAISVSVTGTQK